MRAFDKFDFPRNLYRELDLAVRRRPFTARINNFESYQQFAIILTFLIPLAVKSSIKSYPISLHHHIFRIAIVEHHSRAVPQAWAFVRELPTSAAQFKHDPVDNREARRLFAD